MVGGGSEDDRWIDNFTTLTRQSSVQVCPSVCLLFLSLSIGLSVTTLHNYINCFSSICHMFVLVSPLL